MKAAGGPSQCMATNLKNYISIDIKAMITHPMAKATKQGLLKKDF